MSRGLGWVEQAILEQLGEDPAGAGMSTESLVALVFGTATPGPYIAHGASSSQVRSVARAVRSLQRKGLVVVVPAGGARRRRHVRLVEVGE
jgi:hypothetical protein